MSHLGERVTDLVDGRLDGPATDEVHAHLAGCPSCRQLVETERLTKERLGALDGPDLPDDLTARLLAVPRQEAEPASPTAPAATARSAPSAPSGGSVPSAPSGTPGGSRRPGRAPRGPVAASGPGRSRLSGRPQRARMAAAVAGSLGVVSAGLLGLSVVSPAANAALVPSVNLLVARDVVAMTAFPMLNLTPPWRTAAGAAGR